VAKKLALNMLKITNARYLGYGNLDGCCSDAIYSFRRYDDVLDILPQDLDLNANSPSNQ
jgi:hypothetical protein